MPSLTWMSVLFALVALLSPSVSAQDLDSAANETVYLLNRALTTRDSRERDRLLGALRRLRDPQAAAFYRHLSDMSDSYRQSHGLLGLVETGVTPALTLDAVAQIEDTHAQAELVQAALNDKLIDTATASQWINSSRLTMRTRLELARFLLKEKQRVDPALLREAAGSEDKRYRVLASVLMVQAGDPSGLEYLRTLADATDAESQAFTIDALNLASDLNFDKLGPWAYEVSQKEGADKIVAQSSLAIALKLRAPQAAATWQRTFQAEKDAVQKLRMAMYALNAAPFIDASFYDTLIAASDDMLQKIGRVGRAISAKQGVDEAVLELVQLNHVPFNAWALAFAHEHASVQEAQSILLGLILAFETLPRTNPRTVNDHLELVERAAALLYDRDPQAALPLLQAVLSNPNNDPLFVRRVLGGLFACEQPDAYRVLEGLPQFNDRTARLLVLVLLARSGAPMTQDQVYELGLLVRGGGGLREEARLQTGWIYLKRTRQLEAAMAKLTR